MSIESQIKSLGLKYFDQVGFAEAIAPPSLELYENWLSLGRHGTMDYLQRHLEQKRNPSLLLPKAQSWIVLGLNYDTQEPLSVEISNEFYGDKKGWIARYARGRDYHQEIEDRHNKLIVELKTLTQSEEFLSCVDTKAVLERDTGARAGLGWFGKNTCLIDPKKGSFFFLSEILTTLQLLPDKPIADHCGTCTRCIDACPTGALVAPRELDATKCISYWTIESKQAAPLELANKFSYNFFGCDICQDVCPWNHKARKQNKLPEPLTSGKIDLFELINSPALVIKDKYSKTALNRSKPDRLKENALTVLENLNHAE